MKTSDRMKRRGFTEMECGICGQSYWVKTIGHWYVCSKPSCQAKAHEYLAQDKIGTHGGADGRG